MLILDVEENIRLFFSILSDDRPAIAQTSPAAFLLVRVMCSASKGAHRHLHVAVSTAALHRGKATPHPSQSTVHMVNVFFTTSLFNVKSDVLFYKLSHCFTEVLPFPNLCFLIPE